MKTDILIVGGGTGGVAAAVGACALGRSVVLTEDADWLGGQLTSQGVPPDENPWIELQGCTRRYREFRNRVRQFYRQDTALTEEVRNDPYLNPGGGYVSRLCFDSRFGVIAIMELLSEYFKTGQLKLLRSCKPTSAELRGDEVVSVTFHDLMTGNSQTI